MLRAVVLPWLLARAVGAEPHEQREATPLVNIAASLLIAAALTVAAYAVTRPLVEPGPSPATRGSRRVRRGPDRFFVMVDPAARHVPGRPDS